MDERGDTSNMKSCHSALRQAQRDNQSDGGDAPRVTLRGLFGKWEYNLLKICLD